MAEWLIFDIDTNVGNSCYPHFRRKTPLLLPDLFITIKINFCNPKNKGEKHV